MKTPDFLMLMFAIAFVLGVIVKYIFGIHGVFFTAGLWAGFFSGVMVKNYLFERDPDDDILYVIEKHPDLRDRIKEMINNM